MAVYLSQWLNKAIVLSLLLLFYAVFCFALVRKNLNGNIDVYDTLNYDTTRLRKSNRIKRSVGDSPVSLNFRAFDRHFKLRLEPDNGLFTNDFIVESSGKPYMFDRSIVMKGKLADESDSEVYGTIVDDKFHGKIISNGDEYYVESSKPYFSSPEKFHSVIYRKSDIRFKRSHPISGCGIDQEVAKKIEEVRQMKRPSNTRKNSEENIQRGSRELPTQNTCQLLVQADHTFTKYYDNNIETATGVLSNLVQSATRMYASTDFDGDGLADNIGFIIKRIKINTTADASQPNNPFAPANIGVSKYLDIASQANHNDFCLAVTFANRDFENGVLGLAWVAGAGGAGGICDRFQPYKGQSMSLNSAIVTILNYGSHVSTAVTEVTLAHELGHNFGSQHDPTTNPTCAPGGSVGNFIMYPKATAGNKVNNKKFSSCSKNYIKPILNSRATNSGGCFRSREAAICGNGVVEAGEACDCGYRQRCKDSCCNAPYENSALTPPGYKPCQLVTGKTCSPSAGPCCNPVTCNYQPAAGNVSCAKAGECSLEAFCDGTNYTCPTAEPKPDIQTTCANGVKVCKEGQCEGSICEKFGQVSCTCTVTTDLCSICCMNKTSKCAVASWISGVKNLSPGTPCNAFTGYCDVFGKCRQVNEDGPLNRLTNILFSAETIQNLLDWIKKYPWAVALICLGVIMFMALFIKACSVHTPSSNPTMVRHRQLTLRRSRRYRDDQDPQLQRRLPPSGPGDARYFKQDPRAPQSSDHQGASHHGKHGYQAKAQYRDRTELQHITAIKPKA
ncbi:Disintegrin and metalloproteinase domain-containing protein 10 [Trichoplax sp. H2]|nr:Disintegrin and metalloproteinase domain-containing protein 10 [Trichoplax sp. H2]|eukprot:RDD44962.1 Disintegrin and metalloproteinase domain-containing protein 10 [Trichoplax sp. H2]